MAAIVHLQRRFRKRRLSNWIEKQKKQNGRMMFSEEDETPRERRDKIWVNIDYSNKPVKVEEDQKCVIF